MPNKILASQSAAKVKGAASRGNKPKGIQENKVQKAASKPSFFNRIREWFSKSNKEKAATSTKSGKNSQDLYGVKALLDEAKKVLSETKPTLEKLNQQSNKQLQPQKNPFKEFSKAEKQAAVAMTKIGMSTGMDRTKAGKMAIQSIDKARKKPKLEEKSAVKGNSSKPQGKNTAKGNSINNKKAEAKTNKSTSLKEGLQSTTRISPPRATPSKSRNSSIRER